MSYYRKEKRVRRDSSSSSSSESDDEFIDPHRKLAKEQRRVKKSGKRQYPVMEPSRPNYEDSESDAGVDEPQSKHLRLDDARPGPSRANLSAPSTSRQDISMDVDQICDQIQFVKVLKIEGADGNVEPPANEPQEMKIEDVRQSLALYPIKEDLIRAVQEYSMLVVRGEVGSGKSTQISQYLNDPRFVDSDRLVGCTQPTIVSTISVATRVAQEMGVELGNKVGYKIPFEDNTSNETKIKYMTDCVLEEELLYDPKLEAYGVLIIDDVHKRTLHTDVLLGHIKKVSQIRKDLKIIISCVGLDSAKLSEFFDDIPIFIIPERPFCVDIFYVKQSNDNFIDTCISSVLKIHSEQPPGNVLVFLTDEDEIEEYRAALETRVALEGRTDQLSIYTIHANLSSGIPNEIFQRTEPGQRKIILSTEAAEMSLTIDNVRYVVDPGYVREVHYDPSNGYESSKRVRISRPAAIRRAKCAGRVGPGKCYRLYASSVYEKEMPLDCVPEIQRMNLGKVLLNMKALNVIDILHFDYFESPTQEALKLGLQQLRELGALNENHELTDDGKQMIAYPIDTQMAKMLVASKKYHCSKDILTIAAMMSVNDSIFIRPRDNVMNADAAKANFNHPRGDLLTLLNVFNEWHAMEFSQQWCDENFIRYHSLMRASNARQRLLSLMSRFKMTEETSNEENICRAIMAGYIKNIAFKTETGNYRTRNHDKDVRIHPNSALSEVQPQWVVYRELEFASHEYMLQCTQVESEWV